jgi:CheY-like chemotaxis protein
LSLIVRRAIFPDAAQHSRDLCWLGTFVALAGCDLLGRWAENGMKVGPNDVEPKAEIATTGIDADDKRLGSGEPGQRDWWKVFSDPTLDCKCAFVVIYRNRSMATLSGLAMSQARTRVVCVDDNADIRDLYAAIIGAEQDMEVVRCLPSAEQLVEQVIELKANVVLLDLSMPGKSPLAAINELVSAKSTARVIVFSGHDDDATIDEALDAGAWGLVSKHDDVDQVVNAVRQVASGSLYVRGRP